MTPFSLPPLPPHRGASRLLQVLPDPVLLLTGLEDAPSGPSFQVELNAAARRLLGELPPGQDWSTLFSPELAAALREAVAGAQTGETVHRSADGWHVTACPADEGVWLYLRSDPAQERQIRRELERSEQRYRSLVQATSQIVWNADTDGRFTTRQEQWEAFTGQTPQEYFGDGWIEAIHPDDREHTLRDWHEAVQTRQPYETHHRLRRHDGVYVPMHVRGAGVWDEEGQLKEWVGTHTDNSLQQAAQQALHTLNNDLQNRVVARTQELSEVSQFMALLLTSAGEGIFGLDAEGRNTFVNPAASRLLGYSVAEMLGQPSHELLHHTHADGSPYPAHECPIFKTLKDGQQRRIESDVFWHKSGQPVPISYVVTATLGDDGQPSGAVVMFQDITEQLRSRAELEAAIESLRQSNTELEQFAYVASHDLQEPLRTLGSYAELLGRRYQGQLDERADQYITYMLGAVGRMRSLIQDLLAFSRVGRNGLSPEPTDLDSLMRETARNVEATLETTGGTLTWDTPGSVLGQPSLLIQLLTNLVGNALKFTRPGVPPVVRVTARQVGGEQRIEIQDNGIGIEAEYHERVFTIFQRLHLRETYEGNGIGLAIARKIVTAHGGHLTLESVPGQGSTFTVTLPAAPQT